MVSGLSCSFHFPRIAGGRHRVEIFLDKWEFVSTEAQNPSNSTMGSRKKRHFVILFNLLLVTSSFPHKFTTQMKGNRTQRKLETADEQACERVPIRTIDSLFHYVYSFGSHKNIFSITLASIQIHTSRDYILSVCRFATRAWLIIMCCAYLYVRCEPCILRLSFLIFFAVFCKFRSPYSSKQATARSFLE